MHKTALLTLGIIGLVFIFAETSSAAPVDVFKTCPPSSVCAPGGQNNLMALIQNVISILLLFVGVVSVIMIIIGGIKYVTASGDSAGINSAKNTILYSIVGLVVAMGAYAIVNFVIGRVF